MPNVQKVADGKLPKAQVGRNEKEIAEQPSVPSKPDEKPNVPNYLGKAVASLFCFPPTALVAVRFAAKVNDHLEAGDYDRARAASRRVRKLSKISVILAPIWIITVIVVSIVRSRLG